jgi:hypothetical protein
MVLVMNARGVDFLRLLPVGAFPVWFAMGVLSNPVHEAVFSSRSLSMTEPSAALHLAFANSPLVKQKGDRRSKKYLVFLPNDGSTLECDHGFRTSPLRRS